MDSLSTECAPVPVSTPRIEQIPGGIEILHSRACVLLLFLKMVRRKSCGIQTFSAKIGLNLEVLELLRTYQGQEASPRCCGAPSLTSPSGFKSCYEGNGFSPVIEE